MTKEEYIAMKQAGQYSLPCFYQYYADHIGTAQDKVLRSFEVFSEAFPAWWNQQVLSRNGIVQKVQEHFDSKFGVVKVESGGNAPNLAQEYWKKAQEDTQTYGGEDPFKMYGKNNGL